jgi:hypothetical protein
VDEENHTDNDRKKGKKDSVHSIGLQGWNRRILGYCSDKLEALGNGAHPASFPQLWILCEGHECLDKGDLWPLVGITAEKIDLEDGIIIESAIQRLDLLV